MRDLEAQPCGQASEIDFFDFTDVPSRGGRHGLHGPSDLHGMPSRWDSDHSGDGSSTLQHTGASATLRASTHTFRRTSSSNRRPTHTLDLA
jgi:hypothetical protein